MTRLALTADEVRVILSEVLNLADLHHWHVVRVTEPIPQADVETVRVTVIYEIER